MGKKAGADHRDVVTTDSLGLGVWACATPYLQDEWTSEVGYEL